MGPQPEKWALVIIISYAWIDVKDHDDRVDINVFPDHNNKLA